MSLSEELRNQGNECYRRATQVDAGSSPVKARNLYEQALSQYYQAKEKAEDRKDECSAAKNIGKAAWRIAGVLRDKNDGPETIIFYLHEAIKGFCVAYNHSEDCKDAEWRTDVFETLNVCLQEVNEMADALGNRDQKIAQLEKLCTVNTVVQAAGDIQLALGTLYFHDGTTSLQNGDYKKCLRRMKDCYRPIEEVKRLGFYRGVSCATPDLLADARVLEQDVFYHSCSASSIQARSQGDELLELAMQGEENLDMDLIFDVIDWYKQAVVLAREIDLEQEAIGSSRLGVVYDKVLKITGRAKAYFTKCLELVEALKPRTFFLDKWYKDCTATLKRYQDEARARDEEERQKSRAKFIEDLADELKDLKDHNSGAISFIKHLYVNYPPKISSWVKPGEEDMKKWDSLVIRSKEYKKLVLKVLAFYHPDKVDEKEHGKKWKILCEEITKMLNLHFERTKDTTYE